MKTSLFSRLILAIVRATIAWFGLAACTLLAQTPPNLKIAFIGDQGSGKNARAVLELIKAENAHAVMHQGDLDYGNKPVAWDTLITTVLGADFPYFATIGNHDRSHWSRVNGYQEHIKNRLTRAGVTWEGDLGVQSALHYQGIFIVQVAPDVLGTGHDAFIRDQLAADNSIWSICSWHKNQHLMQVGGKSDEAGWEVYEESRKGGAIIATAHEHSYSRTHLLSDMINQTVASRSDTLVLSKGETFVFVSGLGGNGIRNQEQSGDWWGSIYTSTQNANYGALFGVFNVDGQPNLATFYFKDVAGNVADSFAVRSEVGELLTTTPDSPHTLPAQIALEQNYPNPFNPATTIRFRLAKTAEIKLWISNSLGQLIRTLGAGKMPVGEHEVIWDGRDNDGFMVPSGTYFYRLESEGEVQTKKLVLVQ